MKEIIVVAKGKAKPGFGPALEAEFLKVVPPTHSEAGCMLYAFHRSTEDPLVFSMIEKWASREALDAHLTSPHVQSLFKNIASLLAGPAEIATFESLPAGDSAKGRL